MFNGIRIFAPPEFPVLSLEVQANLPVVEAQQQTQFRLLVRHFMERFFNNDMVSADGETKARILQVVYALALPGMVVALYLFPMYHAPLERPFWSQVSDHYFFVLYSFVAVGAVSIFSWDLLFPDLLDLFVLSPVPIIGARLFRSRIVAAVLFLGLFLLGSNALGVIFYPALSDSPGLARHLLAHGLAVLTSGAFAAAWVLSVQGMMVTVLGVRLSRTISPFLQGIAMMVLLTTFFLFPVTSRFLEALVNLPAARYFPPFWFLGIYETSLAGSTSLPVLRELAKTGCMATALVVAFTIVSYPLAYRRRMRYLVEGSEEFDTRNPVIVPLRHLLHATLLRNAVQRGIYHFISCSLLRTQRHRVYMAMYGGLGLALLLSCTVLMKLSHGHLGFVLSPDGLRASIPIAAFWTIAGLRTAFLSPTDRRGGWIFRVILGKPTSAQLDTTVRWILPCVLGLILCMIALINRVAPPELRGFDSLACQTLLAVSLCLLLTGAMFLKVRTIPFTGETKAPATNLAFILLQYFGLFPPLVLLSVSLEPWLEASVWHVLAMVAVVAAAHLTMLRIHNKDAEYHVNLIDLDEDEEEFPQRLGLRY